MGLPSPAALPPVVGGEARLRGLEWEISNALLKLHKPGLFFTVWYSFDNETHLSGSEAPRNSRPRESLIVVLELDLNCQLVADRYNQPICLLL